MAKRQPDIRWRKKDNEELKRVVKNFNAKITRLEKKDPANAGALPERMYVKDLKEMIKTREDFNREIEALKKFTIKGAEQIVTVPDTDYNIKTTKWQLRQMNERAKNINKVRKQRHDMFKDLPATHGGKELGYTIEEREQNIGMGSDAEIISRPITVSTRTMTRTGLNKRFKTLQKESSTNYWSESDKRMKENYIKGLTDNYNEKDVADIIQAIRDKDFDEFYKIFQQENETFEWVSPDKYGSADDHYQERISHLRSVWVPSK